MRCWLVISSLRTSRCPCALVSWCYVLVDHFHWDLPPHPLSCVWVGEVARTLHHWDWGANARELGDLAVVGEVLISPCLCCSVERFQHQYKPWGNHTEENSACCWSKCICCVAAWTATCPDRSFCQLQGKLVQWQVCGIPNVWYPDVKALLPTNCCISHWLPWPILKDGICSELLGMRRDLRMDGVLSPIAKYDDHKWPVDARPSWCGSEHLWLLPLLLSYLKETGQKDDGGSLVVKFSILSSLIRDFSMYSLLFYCWKEGMDGYPYLDQLTRMKFRLFHLLLEVCKYYHNFFHYIMCCLRGGSRSIPEDFLETN